MNKYYNVCYNWTCSGVFPHIYDVLLRTCVREPPSENQFSLKDINVFHDLLKLSYFFDFLICFYKLCIEPAEIFLQYIVTKVCLKKIMLKFKEHLK